jgi:hypothetical protein
VYGNGKENEGDRGEGMRAPEERSWHGRTMMPIPRCDGHIMSRAGMGARHCDTLSPGGIMRTMDDLPVITVP